ncbi:MAG: glycoside hydrolase family 2 TIM barrel-domain containing protein [Armatimonadota bacterium]|nr:hypothetical protein [bacterium]
MKMFAPLSLLVASVCMCGAIGSAANADVVAPYYPAPKSVQFVSQVIPVADVSATLANGVSLKIGDVQAEQTLNGVWKFSRLTNSTQPFDKSADVALGYHTIGFNDSAWDNLSVPLNWYKQYPSSQKSDAPYVKGWYRRSITIPADKQSGSVVLQFGVIGYEADLYFNGTFVGTHHGDFTPWSVDVTKWVNFGEQNTIAIQVLSDFGPSNGLTTPAKHAYGAQWGIGDIKGGIWQDSSIRYSPSIYIKRALVSPSVSGSSIKVEYWIQNGTSQTKTIALSGVVKSAMSYDSSSQVANAALGTVKLSPGENHGTTTISLTNPHLWTPDDPYLYYMVLALTDNNTLVSASAERFGFRDFKAVGKYFYLNGKRIYLFGENLGSNGYGGQGITSELESTNITNTLLGYKSKGYNIIRTAHMPAVKALYDLADEIGIMLYDEWAWCFTTSIDATSFETNNLAEIQEWVYRDYNHPSVVMWSCGNEINYTNNTTVYTQLGKQVSLVRSLDLSGRPASSFSGAAFDFGKDKLDTDFLDLHRYLGTGSAAWTRCEDDFTGIYNYDAAVYGQSGTLSKPFIIWECIGLSWGNVIDANYVPGDVDKYMQYAEKPTSWETPNGIGFAGLIGLAAALDGNRGSTYAQRIYGRHILEILRYYDNFAGFAPWYLAPNLDAATLWTQPTYCGLRAGTGIPPKHFFSGRTYNPSLFIVNSCNTDWANVSLNIVLVGTDGSQQAVATYNYSTLSAWEKKEQAVAVQIPASVSPGQYQMRLILTCGGQEISRNFYDVFVQSPSITTTAIPTSKNVAILTPKTSLGTNFANILSDLRINATPISSFAGLSQYNVLIIPPASAQDPLLKSKEGRQPLMDWVSKGGTLLYMEQNYGNASLLGGTLSGAETSFVDLVVPNHPIFNGLCQDNFDTWDNSYYGFTITHALSPFTTNALAARCPFQGGSGVLSAVTEGTYGFGRIITSQLCATALWNTDSVATTYLRNLLAYSLGNTMVTTTRPWQLDAPVIPPSASTVSCNKTPETWYKASDFAFNAVGGFGQSYIHEYIFSWDTSATHNTGTSHYIWDAGALIMNTLSSGKYYLHLCGLNSENTITGSFDYGPFCFDNVPPQNPTSATETHGTVSGSWLSGAVTPSFTWPAGTDDASGVAGYLVYFGPDSNGMSTNVVPSTSFNASSIVIGNNYLRLLARDNAGNDAAQWTTAFVLKYDATAPSAPVVTDDGPFSGSRMALHAKWTSSDSESGIVEYMYAIGKSPGVSDVITWTSAGTATDNKITIPSPGLESGVTYYVSVKAKNAAGQWGSVGSSDGIKVIDPSSTIGAAKSLSDDTPVALANKVVSAVFADRYYIEEPDKSSGILVMGQGPGVGTVITIGGVMGTNTNFERAILSAVVVLESN